MENNRYFINFKEFCRSLIPPKFWDKLILLLWRLRLNYSLFTPKIFRQLRNLNYQPNDLKDSKGNILLFQTRSNPPHLAWSSSIGYAFASAGYQPFYLGCDLDLKESCNNFNLPEDFNAERCLICSLYTRKFFENSGISYMWIKEFLHKEDYIVAHEIIDSLDPGLYESFEWQGVKLGEIAKHSVGHYIRKGSLDDGIETTKIYKKFLVNSILLHKVCNKLIQDLNPKFVFVLGGLFMPERIMLEVSRSKGVRVISYEIGLLAENTLMFQLDQPISYDDPLSWKDFLKRPLSLEQEKKLDVYLSERSSGKKSVINYWKGKIDDREEILKYLNIDLSKSISVLFPNITWDSALFEKDIGFKSMIEWIDETTDFFEGKPDHQLIIRCHPAEYILPGSMRESVSNFIKNKYSSHKIPDNIKLIDPDNKISSYYLMDIANLGLVYASSAAIELGIRGKPTIVAAEVHFRDKGFTIDVSNKEQYFQELENLLRSKVNHMEIKRVARLYAYFAFFKVALDFSVVDYKADTQPVFTFKNLEELNINNNASMRSLVLGAEDNIPILNI